jgi:hypothetical protein
MEDSEKYDCSICLDCVDDKIIILRNCKHQFHYNCLKTWYLKSNTCPLCRQSIKDLFIITIKTGFFTKRKYLVDIVENKITFYKVEKNKKNKKNNSNNLNIINYENDNITNYENVNQYENNNNYNSINQENYFINLDKYNILNEETNILFNMVSRIEGNINNGFVKFSNLHFFLDANKKLNIIRKQSTKKKNYNIKLCFKIKSEAIDFFNIFIKRFNYYRELNL